MRIIIYNLYNESKIICHNYLQPNESTIIIITKVSFVKLENTVQYNAIQRKITIQTPTPPVKIVIKTNKQNKSTVLIQNRTIIGFILKKTILSLKNEQSV